METVAATSSDKSSLQGDRHLTTIVRGDKHLTTTLRDDRHLTTTRGDRHLTTRRGNRHLTINQLTISILCKFLKPTSRHGVGGVSLWLYCLLNCLKCKLTPIYTLMFSCKFLSDRYVGLRTFLELRHDFLKIFKNIL